MLVWMMQCTDSQLSDFRKVFADWMEWLHVVEGAWRPKSAIKMTAFPWVGACWYSKRPPWKGGRFEYRHAPTRAKDMPSALPR